MHGVRWFAFICATFAGVACTPPPKTRAAEPPSPTAAPAAVSRPMPPQLGEYRLTEQRDLPGPDGAPGAGGTLYRFRDTSAVFLSVFLYPASSDQMRQHPEPAALARSEGETLLEIMPIQVRRGMYSSYSVLEARADSVRAGALKVPGYVVAVSTLRAGQPEVELQHVYLIGSTFVKVRATVPARSWPRSDLSPLVSTLVSTLAAP